MGIIIINKLAEILSSASNCSFLDFFASFSFGLLQVSLFGEEFQSLADTPLVILNSKTYL